MESIDAMNLGDIARKKLQFLTALVAAFSFVSLSQVAVAQEVLEAEITADPAVAEAQSVADGEVVVGDEASGGFEYFGPEMIKGQPVSYEEDAWGSMNFQPQHTANGEYALWMHDALLMPIITIISLFVLFLLLWVIVKYRRAANPVPSRTSHNTLIEIIWTVVPVLILVVIAVPSITLLSRQFKPAPEDAITIKANGYQWYWGYEYLDNGGFEVISNMLSAEDAVAAGEPHQLAVDNRMVVPVGVPLRIQTFGADVIHSFGIPALWFKLDAVPGRINEKTLTIEEEGIYYGQCMELCGLAHGYMPIAIEARSMDDYNAWVQTQPGGQTRAQIQAAADAASVPADGESAADDESAADGEGAVEASEADAA